MIPWAIRTKASRRFSIVGTAEELLYLLGILMHPDNKAQVLPLILTGPKESADYFRVLDEFITHTLGESARRH